MEKIELLTGVMAKTGDLLEGTTKEMRGLPTPCSEYVVNDLVNHIVGWLQVFDADCNGRTYEGDASTYHCQDHPAIEFKAAATSLLDGWKKFGFDRKIKMMGNEMPADMVFNMTVMEYLTHGWDLAIATGQPIPYTEDEAKATFDRAVSTLPAQYRGDGQPFGNIVAVADSASALDRLVGFMGREPQ